MKIKNETEIQLMKILFKTNGSKATKNITSKRAYPYGTENKYFRQLKSFFKPLTDYVNKYVNENLESLLRGDSTEIKLDAIPGDSFRSMIYNLEDWLSVYMPDIPQITSYDDYENRNNVILTSLGKTAEEAKSFGDKEFEKMLQKGIHVNVPSSAEWWNDMRNSWAQDNYSLITSNAKKYVSQINTLTEQAIVNGMSPSKLKEEIKKATEGLSDKHCKLLARDQMGKLNGQITEAQMQEIGLEMYVWSTSADDRVRDSHAVMEGLLCRYDDASVCSYDNGKTWVSRPSGAVDLHPGQDIQCRCIGLAFYPELEAEMEGTSLDEQIEGLPDVQNLPEFNSNGLDSKQQELYDSIEKDLSPLFKYNFNSNEDKLIYKSIATQDFSQLPESFFEKKNGKYVDYLKNVMSNYYPEKTLRNITAMQNQLDLLSLNNKLNFNVSKDKLNEIEYIYKKYSNEKRIEMLNKFSVEDLLNFAGNNLNDKYVSSSNYLALSKYMDLDGEINNLVRKKVENKSLMYNISQVEDVKNISNAFKKTGFKYSSLEYRNLADVIQNVIPEAGSPWGTADANNKKAQMIAFWDDKYKPFDKKTQSLSKEIYPKISIDDLEKSLSNKKYATSLMKNENAFNNKIIEYGGKKYSYFKNDEFLRMEFDWGDKVTKYKVGDVIDRTGVFSTTPSELHNSIWVTSKLNQGAKNPVRYHLKKNDITDKLASHVVIDDLGTGTGNRLNPEEIDFSISKIKINKIEDGKISAYLNGKEVAVSIKEIWVEVVE